MKHPSGQQLNGNLTLMFIIRCKYYKKVIICGNISLVIALWADIFIAYIAFNSISTFSPQFYLGDLTNFAGSIITFFFIDCCSHHSMVQTNCCIATVFRSATPPEIFLHCQPSANIYLFKVNKRSTRKSCKICSMLTRKTPERRQWLDFKTRRQLTLNK